MIEIKASENRQIRPNPVPIIAIPSPGVWPKPFPFGQSLPGARLPVATLFVNLGPPPAKVLHQAGIDEAEEDDDDAKRQARVERGAEGHGVLCPPGTGASLDVVVEDVADEGPDGEVETRGRGDPGHGAQYHGQVDLPDDAALLVAAVEPERDGEEGAQGEAPHEGAVHGARAEELVDADDAPEDGAVEVDAGDGAGEAVEGGGGAESLDVDEHPVQDADLSNGGDQCRHDLDSEHDPGRDLHVVAELEVGGKLDPLGGGDVSVRDKYHVGYWAAWEHCAANELADEVDAAMLVRNSHNNAIWYKEDCAYSKR